MKGGKERQGGKNACLPQCLATHWGAKMQASLNTPQLLQEQECKPPSMPCNSQRNSGTLVEAFIFCEKLLINLFGFVLNNYCFFI